MREILGFNRLPSFSTVEEFERHLEFLLSGGVYIFEDNGRRFPIFGKALVERINGLRIDIFPKEHAPPHFHVRGPDIDATFRIDTGAFLEGHIDRRSQELIEYWFAEARPRLIEVWNMTRPSDCQVGPIAL
jgi:hypothetical protein